jgi:nicotinate phosphoribosyltransferase
MIARSRKPKSTSKQSAKEKEHLDELLDEGLKETFPASDPLAILEPVHVLPQNENSRKNRLQWPR